jgi:hypothetical protein
VNQISLGFDEAESIEATQELQLSAKDFEEGAVIPLRFVKFQSVSKLTVSKSPRIFSPKAGLVSSLAIDIRGG